MDESGALPEVNESPGEAGRPAPAATPASTGGAASVGAGILASRIFGLMREQAVAFFFGVGPHADALTAALRVPNALQNLLGEGALSASFIPIYSRMIDQGRKEEAGRFAGAIFGLLLATAGGLALAGVGLARPLVAVLAPGFLRDAAGVAAGRLAVDRFELSVHAVRILFPMTGLLVLSVWALAILNSHRRFFLPYFAPVLWNSAMISALFIAGGRHPQFSLALSDRLLSAFCWGALCGGLLQFLVQLPLVVPLLADFRFSVSLEVAGVRQALAAWGPVVAGRGVVQLAGYLDLFLATWLATGGASADRFAQMLYMLPISLFGMSIAASELPELSRLAGAAGSGPALLARVRRALGAVAFLNIPTVVGYLAFGFLIAGALYSRGRFGLADNWLVYLALCGYSTGILATTSSRLLQNTFYALGDTRTPAKIAVQRVLTSAAVAIPLMLWLDRYPLAAFVGAVAGWAPEAGGAGALAAGARGADPGGAVAGLASSPLYLGALGLAFASGAGAWLELARLRRALRRRLPGFDLPWRHDARMALLAAAAALGAGLLWWGVRPLALVPKAVLVLGIYGCCYLVAAHLAGVEELAGLLGRLSAAGRRLRRR